MSNTTSEKPDNILSLARKRDDFFTKTLVIIFLSLGLIGILNHEMWFDELQAWMIARDSSSINNLFQRTFRTLISIKFFPIINEVKHN